ncbi:trypsin-like peptidase domain-containing protein [Streptomyces sp. NPDC057367]|uniref:S1C family serine protease n=1 Tax=Streptomyces sp. NPDC057367 TaxID=3346108 RepID=UPI0036410FB2
MNEGKPTKAKWWSRPRSSDDASDGDFELQRPHTVRATVSGDEAAGEGDFELERPAAPAADDYEPGRPTAVPDGSADAGPRTVTAPHPDPRRTVVEDVEDVEDTGVRVPSGAGTSAGAGPQATATPTDAAALGAAPSDAAAPGTAAGEAAAHAAAPAHAAAERAAVPASMAAPVGAPASTAAPAGAPARSDANGDAARPTGTEGDAGVARDLTGAASVAERPRPLHDPDPYGTPPYGEPGPWAPAPPVQHPATTPAHGTVAAASHTTAGPVAPPPGALPDPAFADAPPPVPSARQSAPVSEVPAEAAGPFAPAVPSPAQPPDALPDPASADAPAGAESGGDGTDPGPWGRYDPWAASAAASLQQNGAAVPTRDQRRRRAGKVILGGALVIALVSGGIGGVVGAYLERNGGVGTVELPQAGKESAERAPDSVAGIAARALPSVVTLHVSGSDGAGTGTGFVLDDRGHILTNNHVVEPAGSGGEITVTFNSGDSAEATVVGRDGGYDLAVVKVKGVSGLTPMPLGNSDNVQVGDPVVAIGAPFDLAGTVTSGIISAKERPITAGGEEGDGSDVSYVDALQTDAPINPGNSGGPLLDAQGRAIGINSAIRSAEGGGAEPDGGQAGSIGLGFAIPINQGKRVAEELINTGRATHPVIGITLDMAYGGDGARVAAKGSDGGPPVTAGGPGDKAGIEAGDVITAVDGRRVHSGEELIVKTRAHRPGDRLELTLERDGEETHVSLVLGSSGGD